MAYVDLPSPDAEEVRLFYTDTSPEPAGDAATAHPVLLVHGYSADSHDWSWQHDHLARTRRVVALDLRGHGASSAPPAGYSGESLAADVVALMDHLGIDTAILMGHSMGATVCSIVAVEHPERVAAMVAVDPAYLVDDAAASALGPLLDGLPDEQVAGFVQGIVGGAMDSPGRDAGLRTWQMRRIEAVPVHVLRQALMAQVSGMAQRSRSEQYLARRTVPVLAFHTDPARAEAEASTFVGQGSRTVVWEGSGHWLHQERSREFNAIVETWLEEPE